MVFLPLLYIPASCSQWFLKKQEMLTPAVSLATTDGTLLTWVGIPGYVKKGTGIAATSLPKYGHWPYLVNDVTIILAPPFSDLASNSSGNSYSPIGTLRIVHVAFYFWCLLGIIIDSRFTRDFLGFFFLIKHLSNIWVSISRLPFVCE